MKKRKTAIVIIISILIIIILTNFYTYYTTKSKFNKNITATVVEEKENPLCPKQTGKLCDKQSQSIAIYNDLCEKKRLMSDTSANYVSDLSVCIINGIYCEKIEGFACHKITNQKIWYGDSCKKSNLEKLGYAECN